MGVTSSALSINLGKRFRCPISKISFSIVDYIIKHLVSVHDEQIPQKKVVILGGGSDGVEALKKLKNHLKTNWY